MIAFGRDLVSLDTLLLSLSDPSKIGISNTLNRLPIVLAEEEFGTVDLSEIDDAKNMVGDWLSP